MDSSKDVSGVYQTLGGHRATSVSQRRGELSSRNKAGPRSVTAGGDQTGISTGEFGALSAGDSEDPYFVFLRERADRLFYRRLYPGNAGDSLIQFATERILQDLGIRTTVDPREADVILIPGGNPTMWPKIGPQAWRTLSARYPRAELVVGPAGFRNGDSDWADVVNDAGSTVTGLFARDPDSFHVLNTAGLRNGISYALSHDPVLHLRHSEWIAAHRRAGTEDHDLLAFRDDHEANSLGRRAWRMIRAVRPSGLRSALIRYIGARARAQKAKYARDELGAGSVVPVLQQDISSSRFEVFIETVRASRTVHTDRLHVMLTAVLLGKKVFAYPTSHAKLEGVLAHSLAGWTDVTFVEM